MTPNPNENQAGQSAVSVNEEQFARLVKLERLKLFEEWLDEWGYSVRDCLKGQSDMFKPCIEQLEHLLK